MANAEAEECKKKGNDAFKERKWDEAIKQYNKAISLDPANAAYYSNRSGAWASKGNHESALADASKCIAQDPKFIKGHTRKGKALFDLHRWDEAEAAYKEGLKVDPGNDVCTRGIGDISAARQQRPAGTGGATAQGSRGGGGGFLPQIMEKLKKGGRMQSYLVMMLAYYAFKTWSGRGSKGSASTTEGTSRHEVASAYDDDVDDDGTSAELPAGVIGQLSREFVEVDGKWLSYLRSPGSKKDPRVLLMLHRTSLSAEAEYGTALQRLTEATPTPGPTILAPDRPCHGYSPCPSGGGGPSNGNALAWLRGLLKAQGGAAGKRRLALVAAGREAATEALSLARQRPDVVHLLLVAPAATAPARGGLATAAGVRAWLEKNLGTATAQAAADAARWAVLGGASKETAPQAMTPERIKVPKLPKSCQVTILYGDDDTQDEDLFSALEAVGAKTNVRSVDTRDAVLDAVVDEVQQVMGAQDAAESVGDDF